MPNSASSMNHRWANWLTRALASLFRVVGAVKDALGELHINTGIAISTIVKVCWLIPLMVVPHLFLTLPSFYRDFAIAGPEWRWAIVILGFISLDLFALARKNYSWQMTALGVGMFFWFFLACFVSQGSPRGWGGLWGAPSAYIYGAGATGCLIGLVVTGQAHKAESMAASFRAWQDHARHAELQGEDWIQPTGAKG